MAVVLPIHPANPQARLIAQAVSLIQDDGIVALPTDARYVLACAADSASAQQAIRRLRQLDDDHFFSLLCADLSMVAEYAQVDDAAFRVLKTVFPGAYTVILKGAKHVGKKVGHPKRKTIGVRIPRHPLVQSLIQALGKPLAVVSLQNHEGQDYESFDDLRSDWEERIPALIDSGESHHFDTTILDLSQTPYSVLRQGHAPAPW